MPTRRDTLRLLVAGFGATALATPALAADGSWDVSYLWAPDLDDVLDYREEVAGVLGPEVARDLTVVRGRSGNWGLVYDRKGTDRATAERVAKAHHSLLHAALGGSQVLATVVRDEGYTRTYNVGYGSLASLDAARERFDDVARLLGPDVHARLVVEKPTARSWAVVYKRLGDAESTARVARRHAELLKGARIPAEAVAERHLDPVWGAGSGVLRTANVGASPSPAPTLASITVAPKAVEAVLSKAVAKDPPKADKPLPRAGAASELPAAIATPLRDALNTHVQGLRRGGVIAGDETTSWYVHTLHDDRTWAAINAERSLQCASMVKPYVALAFLHLVDKGRIVYGPVSTARLEAMIQRSSNSATNWAISKVGGPAAVQKILTDHYGDLLRETHVVEAIPRYGRTYKNRSSARDYVRFCRAMWDEELPKSAELKRLMGLPGRDRLTTGAPHIPAGTQVMNKTGTTSHLVGDFGVIVARKRDGTKVPYAIVGIVEKRNRASDFRAWSTSRGRVIRGVSDLVYTQLKAHYGLV